MAKVSIIMPVFNRERYLERAIASVLAQTFTNFELIVVDDGSTDASSMILDRFARSDRRVRIFRQENAGPGKARNNGLLLARGTYLAFLDSDDDYEPDRIERCVEVMESEPSASVMFHDLHLLSATGDRQNDTYLRRVNFLDLSKEFIERREGNKTFFSKRFYCFMSLRYVAVHTNSVFLRRGCPVEGGLYFPQDLRAAQDADLWFRLAQANKFIYLDAALASYREHAASISSNPDRLPHYAEAHFRNLRRSSPYFDASMIAKYRKKIAGYWCVYGYHCLIQDRRRAACTAYWKASRIYPTRVSIAGMTKSLIPWASLREYAKWFQRMV